MLKEADNPIRLKKENMIGEDEFKELLWVLNRIFPEDYTIINQKPYLRAEFLFGLFKLNKITKTELEKIMRIFSTTHKSLYWTPADFLEIWQNI